MPGPLSFPDWALPRCGLIGTGLGQGGWPALERLPRFLSVPVGGLGGVLELEPDEAVWSRYPWVVPL